jgi:uncharacterized protein YneR
MLMKSLFDNDGKAQKAAEAMAKKSNKLDSEILFVYLAGVTNILIGYTEGLAHEVKRQRGLKEEIDELKLQVEALRQAQQLAALQIWKIE